MIIPEINFRNLGGDIRDRLDFHEVNNNQVLTIQGWYRDKNGLVLDLTLSSLAKEAKRRSPVSYWDIDNLSLRPCDDAIIQSVCSNYRGGLIADIAVMVRPEAQRQGLAHTLVKTAEKLIQSEAKDLIQLTGSTCKLLVARLIDVSETAWTAKYAAGNGYCKQPNQIRQRNVFHKRLL